MLLAVSDSLWPFGLQLARLPGSSLHEIFQSSTLECVAISSSTIYSRTFLSPLEKPHLLIPFYPPALGNNHQLLSVLMGFPVWYQWTHCVDTMCGLFSLSIMFARFIHVATCIHISFIFMAELCRYITFCLPICLVMAIWTFLAFWQLWLVLLWTFLGTFLCSCMSSFILCRYLGLKLLGHTTTACLMFFWNYQSVSIASTLLITSLHVGLLFCQMEIIRVPALLGSCAGMKYCRPSPPASSLALHQSLNEC